MVDPLGDVVGLLAPSAAIAKPIAARGRWGIRYGAHGAPGFTIVLAGGAWLALDGQEPLYLAEGDFLLLPTTPAFSLSSEPGILCVPAEPQDAPVRHGDADGDADFVALGGSFTFDRTNASLLLALMPTLIHVPAANGRASRISRLIALIADECSTDFPGKDLIIRHMLGALLIEALRSRGSGGEGVDGLLAGLHDPALAPVLQAMHADVRSNWTVAGLAKLAGMSRSGFAAQFRQVLGCGPIEYLAGWRMAVARAALARGVKSLDRIAEEIGYDSASAFSTAFRKRYGCPPGKFARAAV